VGFLAGSERLFSVAVDHVLSPSLLDNFLSPPLSVLSPLFWTTFVDRL